MCARRCLSKRWPPRCAVEGSPAAIHCKKLAANDSAVRRATFAAAREAEMIARPLQREYSVGYAEMTAVPEPSDWIGGSVAFVFALLG